MAIAICNVHAHSPLCAQDYFYPDCPRAIKFSQYELTFATGGWSDVEHEAGRRGLGSHVAPGEDADKNLPEGLAESATDGLHRLQTLRTPLCEIVSEAGYGAPDEPMTT